MKGVVKQTLVGATRNRTRDLILLNAGRRMGLSVAAASSQVMSQPEMTIADDRLGAWATDVW